MALRTRQVSSEHGIALIVTLMAMALLMALGSTLVLTTTVETRIWAQYRDGVEAQYAAEAAAGRAIQDLSATSDWSSILAGLATSTFVDGPPAGPRVAAGITVNLTEATNRVRCGKSGACTDADITARTEERPWGRNNPHWQLYAYGPLSALLPGDVIRSRAYVMVWIGDDPSETDDDWGTDGGPPPGDPDGINPGRGVLVMLAHAHGPAGVRRGLEVTLERAGHGSVRILSWRELR